MNIKKFCFRLYKMNCFGHCKEWRKKGSLGKFWDGAHQKTKKEKHTIMSVSVVTCSPRDSRFAESNPGEVDGFFQDVKILNTSPPGGTLRRGARYRDYRLVKEPQA